MGVLCLQYIKEHNLKANHNSTPPDKLKRQSVCNISKNTIWKQITTVSTNSNFRVDLFAIYQRTQSESKSQPVRLMIFDTIICLQYIKEHNLKANHNHSWPSFNFVLSVCNISKNTIWKQITTRDGGACHLCFLFAIYQRTQSESKSQLYTAIITYCLVCLQYIKEHNLKANHNSKRSCYFCKRLFAIYQRTQSESKSQQGGVRPGNQVICLQYIKEHNLKANHNPDPTDLENKTVCLQYIKEHNLKANHNIDIILI